MKKSDIINKLHLIVYLYMVFGWLISEANCKFLLFFSPTVITQWGINNNECVLTQLENKYIREENKDNKEEKEDKDIKEETFLKRLCDKYNINISENVLDKLTYFVAYHSFIQSYWRVVFYL